MCAVENVKNLKKGYMVEKAMIRNYPDCDVQQSKENLREFLTRRFLDYSENLFHRELFTRIVQ